MSVFTPVTEDQAHAWLKNYTLGHLTKLEGITSGIENSNFFLSTNHGEYVLTLFEKLSLEELPFYIDLMSHLAHRGIPCPLPIERIDGRRLDLLNDKPALIVTKLTGKAIQSPSTAHCAEVGEMLAEMHLAGASYPQRMENWRGLRWWKTFVSEVTPLLPEVEANFIKAELAFQEAQDFSPLPQGVIHGDLFRDNVLFVGDRIGGVIDFYFACNETLLFDLAVTLNDWCVRPDATVDVALANSLIDAYHSVRPLTDAERHAWPAILRAAAFRSWLGRLGYTYFPQPGEITHTKDHGHFQRLLEYHIGNRGTLPI
ncbi:MAG TPA: homoserine kinase [Burkholderiales bacterium]|nr:homoserine kinase [Burkholderiales bacterium]